MLEKSPRNLSSISQPKSLFDRVERKREDGRRHTSCPASRRERERDCCCCCCEWLVYSMGTVVTTIWRSRIPVAPSRFSRAVADRAQGPPFPLNRLPFRDLSLRLAPDRRNRDPTIAPTTMDFDKKAFTSLSFTRFRAGDFLEFALTLVRRSRRGGRGDGKRRSKG